MGTSYVAGMTTVLESPTGVRRSDEVVIESLGDTELLDRYVAGPASGDEA